MIGGLIMRNLDWQMILFVGSSLAHDYWIYWGLPQIHYWEVKQESSINEDDNNGKRVA